MDKTKKENVSDNSTDGKVRNESPVISRVFTSRSNSASSSRENTPAPLPKYHYTSDELTSLRESPVSHSRPPCLSKEHDTSDGLWDPERWFRSFDNSRGNSPLTFGSRDRKRPSELDREVLKRRPSDPKGRIREEEEDGLGIVLSPQRRSFGTGCHVSTPVNPQRRCGSPNDSDRDGRDRRDQRRIGSGRIQIGHDRHDRDFRDPRGRFDRDNHRFERPDRFRRDSDRDRDRDIDRRDFGDRRYDSRRRDYRREEEPEWYTGGPSSQNETIELRGFDEERSRDNDRSEPKKKKVPTATLR